MAKPRPKPFRDQFAAFVEDPSRESLRILLRDNLGETSDLDFKADWPSHASLAKHILGMANTGPGCVLIGVQELNDKTLDPVGLQQLVDKADVVNGLKGYLPNELLARLAILDFSFDASEYPKIVGKRFQCVLVDYDVDHTPLVSIKNGDGIRAAAVYVRREGSTEEATHDELQRLINRRIDAGYSTSGELDLKKHIEQLRVLYSEVHIRTSVTLAHIVPKWAEGGFFRPRGPRESLDDFVERMIVLKKRIIARELGIPDVDFEQSDPTAHN